MKTPIYMDHHATTPVDERVVAVMLPYFTEIFGNAASTDHSFGAAALRAVDGAREETAKIIGARPEEIIFTSGATESDNLAILGAVEAYSDRGDHVITCVTEHKAVLDTCEYLEASGRNVTYLPVDSMGLVDLDALRSAITPKTVLISIMAANNEIGVLAPLKEIGEIAREHEVLFHTDATQAVGHVPVDMNEMNIDLLSLSGHKIYGPKGVGALYVRSRRPYVKLAEQIHGGGHERGMRSGTTNVAGVVGLGAALNIARTEMVGEATRLAELRDQLWQGLQAGIDNVELNGHPTKRLPHNLSCAIPGVESQALLVQLKDDVALSTGSACTTAKVEPSHVIMALGYDEARAHSSLRFGLGRSSLMEEVLHTVEQTTAAVQKIGLMTP